MPSIRLDSATMAEFGDAWLAHESFTKKEGIDFGYLVDEAVATAMAEMLGGIPLLKPSSTQLQPSHPDCVEVGPVRIVGGVRPQNFDVGYRPDGVRIAFDSKTLNDDKSVGKNWQNMINDLATEASTVHTRFPTAVVSFLVLIPSPCLQPGSRSNSIIGTLTRLGGRRLVDQPMHQAEVMSLISWQPKTGRIDPTVPDRRSPLRIEQFGPTMQEVYVDRFQGLPPHAA